MSTTNRIDPIQMINVDRIDPHPLNPRHDLGDLGDLVKSIKAQGIRQNLLLVPNGTSDTVEEDGTIRHTPRYTVVIGHRRLAAAKIAKLDQVPVSIDRNLDEAQQLELMLVENLQRTDLTPIEEAEGYRGLFDLGVTEAGISKAIGIGAKTIKSRLQLLTLPEVARFRIHNGQGSLVDAVALEGFADDEALQVELAEFLGTVNFAVKVQAAKDRRKRLAAVQPIIDALVARGAVEHVRGPGADGVQRQYGGHLTTVGEADKIELPEGSTYEPSEYTSQVTVFVPYANQRSFSEEQAEREALWAVEKEIRDALSAQQDATYAVRDQFVREFSAKAKVTVKEKDLILSAISDMFLAGTAPLADDWEMAKWLEVPQETVVASLAEWSANLTPAMVLLAGMHVSISRYVTPDARPLFEVLEHCGYIASDVERGWFTKARGRREVSPALTYLLPAPRRKPLP